MPSPTDREQGSLVREAPGGSTLAVLRGFVPFAIVIVLGVLAQMLVKPALDSYSLELALSVGINVMLAVSLTIVNGFTGQFSMGHAGFLAVGGYASACLTYYGSIAIFGDVQTHGGWLSGESLQAKAPTGPLGPGEALFACSLLLGGLVSACVGYLVGLPSLRLKGDYLAIVTLGFGEIVRVVVQRSNSVLRPQQVAWETVYPDMPAPAPGAKVLAYAFSAVDKATGAPVRVWEAVADTPWWKVTPHLGGALGFSGPKYTSLFWVVLLTGATLVVAFRLKHSTFGRALLSIREDEVASEAMGVNTTRYKVRAFVLAAFFAGVAGAMFAHFKSLTPAEVGFDRSFNIIIMVVLGGLGSISGAALAAVIVTLLPEFLRLLPRSMQFLDDYRMVLWSLALVVMMIFRPSGLLGVRELWDFLPGRRTKSAKGSKA
jgi:branched-chain amino acid transport system permease protein